MAQTCPRFRLALCTSGRQEVVYSGLSNTIAAVRDNESDLYGPNALNKPNETKYGIALTVIYPPKETI